MGAAIVHTETIEVLVDLFGLDGLGGHAFELEVGEAGDGLLDSGFSDAEVEEDVGKGPTGGLFGNRASVADLSSGGGGASQEQLTQIVFGRGGRLLNLHETFEVAEVEQSVGKIA